MKSYNGKMNVVDIFSQAAMVSGGVA